MGEGPAQASPGQRGGDTAASPGWVHQQAAEVVASRSVRGCLIGGQFDDPAIGPDLAVGLGDEHLAMLTGDVPGELLPAVAGLDPKRTRGQLDRGCDVRPRDRLDWYGDLRHSISLR
jgi:hypothetical protein